MKKILVSDYDGTFYINDEDIKNNIKKVKELRSRNNIFCIATGRSYYDFNRALKEYPIEYDYLIINHGATILNNNEEIIRNYSIKDEIKDNLIRDLNLRDQENMFVCKELDSRVSIKESQVTKIHIRFETIEKAKKINKIINEKYADEVNSYLITSSNAIEIISTETNKANAINIISKIEQVNKNDIYTIGDSYNDIEMITAYNGNCMENAENEVKQICANNYDSVSKLINELLKE